MRIVVTGLGLVTPLGCGVTPVWEKLIAGQSGIRRISSFDVSSYPSQIAGQIPEPLEFFEQWVSKKDQRKMGRFILWAMAAAEEALADAGWKPQTEHDRERTGVLVGSGIGGLDEISHWSVVLHEKGPSRVGPFFVPSALINLASGHISIRHGFTGPNLSVVTACSTGAHAIGEAAKMIRSGQADIVVAGGGEAAVCPMGVAGFSAMKALSTNFNDHPEKASRPWDKQRDGFVIGEGAGVVVLESLDHAQKRGAKIYAELLGYGMSGDAYHMAAPRDDGDGAFRCMKAALKDARLEPHQVQYINAHGTSTPPGDIAELQAIERLFPEKTVVSSTKSSIGHLLGAAGSVEAIFSILTMNTGVVPPTLNLDDPEPTQMDLVAHTARTLNQVNYVLSNSFGFGGTNASLVFGKV
jgi:3-oxoacyl-[acyl-carrier-protein] synthase II